MNLENSSVQYARLRSIGHLFARWKALLPQYESQDIRTDFFGQT